MISDKVWFAHFKVASIGLLIAVIIFVIGFDPRLLSIYLLMFFILWWITEYSWAKEMDYSDFLHKYNLKFIKTSMGLLRKYRRLEDAYEKEKCKRSPSRSRKSATKRKTCTRKSKR